MSDLINKPTVYKIPFNSQLEKSAYNQVTCIPVTAVLPEISSFITRQFTEIKFRPTFQISLKLTGTSFK